MNFYRIDSCFWCCRKLLYAVLSTQRFKQTLSNPGCSVMQLKPSCKRDFIRRPSDSLQQLHSLSSFILSSFCHNLHSVTIWFCHNLNTDTYAGSKRSLYSVTIWTLTPKQEVIINCFFYFTFRFFMFAVQVWVFHKFYYQYKSCVIPY